MRREAGFTLLELLVTVAMIGILATIALPALSGSGRNARGLAEVQPMFQDIRNRLEQSVQEAGAYPVGDGESTYNPTTPSSTPQALTMTTTWTAAKIRLSNDTAEVCCGYTWVTGAANDNSAVGAEATAFGFTAPTVVWYYILARCDFDGDSAVDSFYFTSSVDPTILKRNEGH